MSESPEDQERQEPAEGSLERKDMEEKAAGFRASHPPTESDVDAAEQGGETTAAAPGDVDIDEDAGDRADAVEDAPEAAKPGHKQDPDMKDMGVGPRPTDDQSAR